MTTQTHSLLIYNHTPSPLQVWLGEQIEPLCQAISERLPNMLVSSADIATLLRLLVDQLDAAPENQLAKIQFWAITEVGYDAPFAGDWRTVLRVLKHELVSRLEAHFAAAEALQHWRVLDELFTYALIEVTQLSTDIDHAVMLDHVVSLRQQTEKLEQSKTNFVVVAAHELRTPLTILEGYAKMLAAETQEEPTLGVYVRGLLSGLQRMKDLITDLIDVSLLDLHTMEVEYNQFYLEKIILMVADTVASAFAERQVELLVEPLAVQHRIYGDAERLAKAFTKVLMNGLKYTPDGARVTVRGVVQAGGETAVDYIDVQIADTGIGINPEDLEVIFHKFSSTSDVKLHSSGKTKFKGDGPGLGLPIAKGIIEAHGGRIWAESPGCDEKKCPGSTFHIELPILLEKPS